MPVSRLFVLLAVLTAASACDDNKTQPLPTAPMNVAPNAVSAYIAASSTNPATGSDVTVWVKARRGSAVGPIGSFTIRLAFDSTRLRYVDVARSTFGMVMANPAKAGTCANRPQPPVILSSNYPTCASISPVAK